VTFATTASQFQATPATLPAFTVVAGTGPSAPQTISLVDPDGAASWSTAVTYGGAVTGWLTVTPTDGNLPATAAVTVAFPANVTPGTYGATVSVTSLGTTRPVAVSATVSRPGIVAPPGTVSLSAVRNQAPLPSAQELALTTAHGEDLSFTTSVVYGAGAAGWLSVAGSGTAPGPLSVGVSTTDLAAGTYGATLRLTPGNGAAATLVDVSYAVTAPALSASPSPLAFTVDAATTIAGTQASLALTSGGSPVAWTASATQPWLQVTPAGGTTPSSPAVSLVVAELETLPPGAHAAAVTLTYETAPDVSTTVNVPVSLLLDLPLLTVVAPRVSVAGVGGEVILRGSGVPPGFTGPVRFGGEDASAQTRVSSTEVRATPPTSLAPGSHLATVQNALGLSRSTARLEVVAEGSLTAAAIASAGTKAKVVYDDASRSVYVANTGTGKIDRHREAAGWAKAGDGSDEVALAGLKNIALSPDGGTLLAVAGTSFRVVETAPLTLAATQPTATAPSDATVLLEMTHAAKAVYVGRNPTGYTTAGLFDLATGSATPLGGFSLYGAGLVSGASGARVGFLMHGISTSAMRVWDAGTGAVTTTSVVTGGYGPRAGFGSFDRTASRLAIYGHFSGSAWVSRLHDSGASYGLLSGTVPPEYAGAPPAGATPPTLALVLSPRGRARAFTWDGTSVRCFDTAGAPDVNGVHPLLFAVTPIQPPGASAVLAIATDERTAFVAGDDRLVVVPLPP
jgi:hypothetical protein